MPKHTYEVTFTEVTQYTVVFESDADLDPCDEASWFEAMDAAKPDWLTSGETEVSIAERDLNFMKKDGTDVDLNAALDAALDMKGGESDG